MTWEPRRKNWVSRAPDRDRREPPAPPAEQSTGPVVIPLQEFFYPPDVAVIVTASRSLVWYWINNQKLGHELDFAERIIIRRPELVRFCKDYLKRDVA